MNCILKYFIFVSILCSSFSVWLLSGSVLAQEKAITSQVVQETSENSLPLDLEPIPVNLAEEDSEARPVQNDQVEDNDILPSQIRAELRKWTFLMAMSVLAFGLIVILLEVWVMVRSDKYWEAYSFKLVGVTIIITAGMFLIIAGYSDEQLSPIMGLLGTTIGYILGRESEGKGQVNLQKKKKAKQ